MRKLEEEMQASEGKRKQELEKALKQFEKEKEEMELLSQEMIYRRFYNSIYVALKERSEEINEDLLKDCKSLEEIIAVLEKPSNYLSKIWWEGVQKPDKEDWGRFLKYYTRNSHD